MSERWKCPDKHRIEAVVRQYGLHIHHSFAKSLNWIWRKGGRKARLGLAISGGVDSMALARLCHDVLRRDSAVMAPLWTIPHYPRTEASCTAFIVDHRLRKDSAGEAEQVAAELARLDIESEILALDWRAHGDPTCLTNLESVARKLRYQAIGRACTRNDISSLLLAHHADDQAETVMARMVTEYMGLGLGGIRPFAAIPDCLGLYGVHQSGGSRLTLGQGERNIGIAHGGVYIARPLLPLRKQQLIEICQHNGVRWFEDATNADPTLTLRNSVRSLQKKDALPLALRTPRLLEVADTIRRRRSQYDTIVEKVFNAIPLTLDVRSGTATVVFGTWLVPALGTAYYVRAALVRRLMETVAPKEEISLQGLDSIVDVMFRPSTSRNGECSSGPPSLQVAGVAIKRRASTTKEAAVFEFHRAVPTARELEDLPIRLWPDRSQVASREDGEWSRWRLWDGRYWIKATPPRQASAADTVITVRFLTEADVDATRGVLDEDSRRVFDSALRIAKGRIRLTVPAIVLTSAGPDKLSATESVVALPSLQWSSPGWTRDSPRADNTLWRWDVKYQHVQLGLQDLHSVRS